MLSFWMLTHSKMSTTLSSPLGSIRLYFEYYQLPLIFIIIPFFAISITNGESTFYSFAVVFFCGMKLQFSENIKTIIKIQRFSIEWQSALNSFCCLLSLSSAFEIQKKIIYQIMRAPKNNTKTKRQTKKNILQLRNFQYSNFYIFMLICIFVLFFGRQEKGRKGGKKLQQMSSALLIVRQEEAARQQAIYFELIVF